MKAGSIMRPQKAQGKDKGLEEEFGDLRGWGLKIHKSHP
jgi:hypothetical protein